MKERTTIEIEKETLKKLKMFKAKNDFSSYDAVLSCLFNNTRRLKELLK
jgi:hypothetical protein